MLYLNMKNCQFFWKQMEQALNDTEAWPLSDMDPAYAQGRSNVICRDSHIDLQMEKATDLWHYCHLKRGPAWWPKGAEAWTYAEACLFVEVWLFCWGCASGESGRPLRAGEGGTWWPVLVALPLDGLPENGVLTYTCPALAAVCNKCWY